MSARVRPISSRLVLALALLLVAPAMVHAQGSGDGFLFRRPVASVTFRFGYAVPRAENDIAKFIKEFSEDDAEPVGDRPPTTLTVSNASETTTLGGELSFRATERLDIGVGLAYARAKTRSEYLHWIGVDDLPIEQETRLTRVPLTANVKYYLMDRGRSIGRFAWVPAKWAPYLGAGVGYMWYRFHQSGEFLDYLTLDDPEGPAIFQDTFEFDGWTPTFQVIGGADYSLSNHLVLTGQAGYGWASVPMGPRFVDFNDLDLAGLHASVGLSIRF